MTVYENLIEMSKKHIRIKNEGSLSFGYSDMFKINLRDKTIYNGCIYIYKNGILMIDKIELYDGTIYIFKDTEVISKYDNFYETVEELYENFNFSVPTKYDNSCRTNFLACHSDELSMHQIINNEKRQIARCKLEAYIFCMAITNQIQWYNSSHFFWKSNKFSSLILFKDWI